MTRFCTLKNEQVQKLKLMCIFEIASNVCRNGKVHFMHPSFVEEIHSWRKNTVVSLPNLVELYILQTFRKNLLSPSFLSMSTLKKRTAISYETSITSPFLHSTMLRSVKKTVQKSTLKMEEAGSFETLLIFTISTQLYA